MLSINTLEHLFNFLQKNGDWQKAVLHATLIEKHKKASAALFGIIPNNAALVIFGI